MAALFHLEGLQTSNRGEREREKEKIRGKYYVTTQCRIDPPISKKHSTLPTYKSLLPNLHLKRANFLKNKSRMAA